MNFTNFTDIPFNGTFSTLPVQNRTLFPFYFMYIISLFISCKWIRWDQIPSTVGRRLWCEGNSFTLNKLRKISHNWKQFNSCHHDKQVEMIPKRSEKKQDIQPFTIHHYSSMTNKTNCFLIVLSLTQYNKPSSNDITNYYLHPRRLFTHLSQSFPLVIYQDYSIDVTIGIQHMQEFIISTNDWLALPLLLNITTGFTRINTDEYK